VLVVWHVRLPRRPELLCDPRCQGTEFEAVELSRRGKVWSYTDARYTRAAVCRSRPYVPFAIVR